MPDDPGGPEWSEREWQFISATARDARQDSGETAVDQTLTRLRLLIVDKAAAQLAAHLVADLDSSAIPLE